MQRPFQDASIRWLPVALAGLGLASGALAESKTRQIHEELGDRIRASEVRLETFCPQTWWEVRAGYERLGQKLRKPKLFFREHELFEPWFLEAEADCMELARDQVRENVARLRRRMGVLREAQTRAALSTAPQVSLLMEEASHLLDEADPLLGQGADVRQAQLSYVDLERRSVDLFNRLDTEVVDPCQRAVGLASHALAMDNLDQARKLLGPLDPAQCVDMSQVEWLKKRLKTRLEKSAMREAPSVRPLDRAPPRKVPTERAPPPVRAETRPLETRPLETPPPEVRPRKTRPLAPPPKRPPEPQPVDTPSLETPPEPSPPDDSWELPRGDGRIPIALTVWQSAWGDFSEISRLGEFARRNGIREIYLNPGLGITRDTYPAALRRMRPLVEKLRAYGIDRIGFLYAELRYKVGEYARFLRTHPELGIRTLIDDSEFTDMFKDRFERNSRAVRQEGVEYAAFVTLEKVGNSGVSDETRYWALEHLDQTMLMSYFGCTFEEQKEWLEPYLAFADRKGRPRSVSITLLMGSKKVGREVSCERQLGEREFHHLIRNLHAWASGFRSYRGIVLENNRPLPRYDVAPMTGAP